MCPSSLKTFIFFLLVFVPWPHFCGHTAVLPFSFILFKSRVFYTESLHFYFWTKSAVVDSAGCPPAGVSKSADICYGDKKWTDSALENSDFTGPGCFVIIFGSIWLMFIVYSLKNAVLPFYLLPRLCVQWFLFLIIFWKSALFLQSIVLWSANQALYRA